MFFLRGLRQSIRPHSTTALIFIIISSFLIVLHLYHKHRYQEELTRAISPAITLQSRIPTSLTSAAAEKSTRTGIVV